MKNINKYISNRINKAAMLLFIALSALIIYSCQTPVEPVAEIKGSKTTIKVIDQTRAPISNAIVLYGDQANKPIASLSNFASGYTNIAGEVSSSFTVPSSGLRYTFGIFAPKGAATFLQDTIYDGSVKIPCQDTTITYRFNRLLTVNCASPIGQIDVAPISICYTEKSADTVFTPFYAPNCPDSMLVEASSFTTLTGASVVIMKMNLAGVTSRVNSPFTIAPGEQFEVGMIYTAQTSDRSLDFENITVNITPKNQAKYTFATFKFGAESKCNPCSCPDNKTITYNASDKFCVNSAKDFDVTLNEVINSSKECKMRYRIKSRFTNSGISVNSINGSAFQTNEFELAPGEALKPMSITATLSVVGAVKDSSIYSISMIDASGAETPCVAELKVILNLLVESPCPIYSPASTIFQQPFVNYDSTVTLKEGVNTASNGNGQAYYAITNPSSTCDLIIPRIEIFGAESGPFYFAANGSKVLTNVVIPAGAQIGNPYYLWIAFRPTDADYIRGSSKVDFKATVRFTVNNAPTCNLQSLPLKGTITLPTPIGGKLYEMDQFSSYNGIFLNTDGSIQTGNYQDKNCAIYVSNVNVASNSADLESGGPSIGPQAGTKYVSFAKIEPNVWLALGKGIDYWANDPTNAAKINAKIAGPYSSALNVNPKDMVLVKYSFTSVSVGNVVYYGLMYVTGVGQLPNGQNYLDYSFFTGF